jgi:Fe-S cluster assembly iron-binding protein IscA
VKAGGKERAAPLTISPEAARRLSAGADFTRAVLSVRHVLGCGGSGFRVSVEEKNVPEEGLRFESQGIPIVMDDYAVETLNGAVLEIDPDPSGEGYRQGACPRILAGDLAVPRTPWTTPTRS